jgi:hypothetical protein
MKSARNGGKAAISGYWLAGKVALAGEKRVPRDRYPKQRGTILKTDKNMHRGGMKRIYLQFSSISGGGILNCSAGIGG